eukprot:10453014-Heterocapsa_arctica.AAC.1
MVLSGNGEGKPFAAEKYNDQVMSMSDRSSLDAVRFIHQNQDADGEGVYIFAEREISMNEIMEPSTMSLDEGCCLSGSTAEVDNIAFFCLFNVVQERLPEGATLARVYCRVEGKHHRSDDVRHVPDCGIKAECVDGTQA